MACPFSPHQIHRVLDQAIQHAESVAHATRAPRKIDDETPAPHAGGATGERGAGELGIDGHPERLGDAGGLAVEHRSGGFGGDVARGEAGAAGGEDQVGLVAVGPGGDRCGDAAGLVGHQGAASAKVIATDWIDYLHLARWNGRWLIVNVLWELKPPEARATK